MYQIFISIRRFFRHIYYYLTAETFVAVYPDIKAKEYKANLFEYHPDRFYDIEQPYNLGDYLSFVVVEWMLKREKLQRDSATQKKYTHLNSIGSNVFSSYQNSTIWGSGAGAKDELSNRLSRIFNRHPMRRLDIRAVRGPYTREKLIEYGHKCPEVYGDPAILMPLIYAPSISDKKRDVLIIPQFLYEKEVKEKYQQYEQVSMNTNDYEAVINAIVSSKKVITSSLHAIILAEVYGIPAVFFQSLPKDFKFRDYYASTGRYDVKIAHSIEEALTMEPMPIPDFSKIQSDLIDSFPYDLWK